MAGCQAYAIYLSCTRGGRPYGAEVATLVLQVCIDCRLMSIDKPRLCRLTHSDVRQSSAALRQRRASATLVLQLSFNISIGR